MDIAPDAGVPSARTTARPRLQRTAIRGRRQDTTARKRVSGDGSESVVGRQERGGVHARPRAFHTWAVEQHEAERRAAVDEILRAGRVRLPARLKDRLEHQREANPAGHPAEGHQHGELDVVVADVHPAVAGAKRKCWSAPGSAGRETPSGRRWAISPDGPIRMTRPVQAAADASGRPGPRQRGPLSAPRARTGPAGRAAHGGAGRRPAAPRRPRLRAGGQRSRP
jgi:hypothetical protein